MLILLFLTGKKFIIKTFFFFKKKKNKLAILLYILFLRSTLVMTTLFKNQPKKTQNFCTKKFFACENTENT